VSVPASRLTALQVRVLEALSGFEPAFVLTGGGALAGFHTGHRPTLDLDLFWIGRRELDRIGDEVERRLVASGLHVEAVQSTPAFRRLRVQDDRGEVLVDLVAEPVPSIEEPVVTQLGTSSVRVDTPFEILVNKLCALIHRSELRDLVDVQRLVEGEGLDLDAAIRAAPRKDAGFSPLMLSFLLTSLPVERLDVLLPGSGTDAASLTAFRDRLLTHLTGDASG
jgi:hypothetical protein